MRIALRDVKLPAHLNASERAGDMLRYTKDHEWLRLDGDIATVGITPFAQEKLGDLVFVELPGVGAKLERAAVAATVESVKAAAEVYAPVSGEIVEVNEKVTGEPGLVNSAPTGDGWLFKMKVADMAELDSLLDEQAYQAIST
jgi:glycine cleavage system H protein